VVVVLVGGRPPKPPLGLKLAQAASAALIAGVVVVVEVDPPPPKPPKPPEPLPVGTVTPCSFRQFRYAANSVEPAPPPPKLGRRLAHADMAFWSAALSDAENVGRVAPGVLEGGPPEPAPPNPPAGKLTPWLLRQFSYAVNEALEPPGRVVEVLDEFDADAPLLHAARRIPSAPSSDAIVAIRTLPDEPASTSVFESADLDR
jgi:hypothetical protein